MNDMIRNDQSIGEMIHGMMMPILEPLCLMIKQNTEALERISATLNLQGKQIEALERQVRMNTPVTSVQARYLNSAIRDKSYEIISKYGRYDNQARDALSRRIRKDILLKAGIGSMRELPRCEYDVALRQIETWNNALIISEIIRKKPEQV